MLVRYEDFAARPLKVVEAIGRHVGNLAPAPFVDRAPSGRSRPTGVGGNPERVTRSATWHRAGTRSVAPGMPGLDRWVTTAVSAPLLSRYGYGPRVEMSQRPASGRPRILVLGDDPAGRPRRRDAQFVLDLSLGLRAELDILHSRPRMAGAQERESPRRLADRALSVLSPPAGNQLADGAVLPEPQGESDERRAVPFFSLAAPRRDSTGRHGTSTRRHPCTLAPCRAGSSPRRSSASSRPYVVTVHGANASRSGRGASRQ